LFAGSGTTALAAAANGRRYLSADLSPQSLSVTRKRLLETEYTLSAPFHCPNARLEAEFIPGIAYHDIYLSQYIPPQGEIRGLDAIDQWSVGFYQDGAFYAQASAARRKHTPDLPALLQLPQLRGTPAILIIDIYGNRSLWRQKEDEE